MDVIGSREFSYFKLRLFFGIGIMGWGFELKFRVLGRNFSR